MQKEIQALVVAIHNDHKKEMEFLQGVLAAIAVGGAARKNTMRDIADAVAQAAGVDVGASSRLPAWYEGDVATAINAIRTRAA